MATTTVDKRTGEVLSIIYPENFTRQEVEAAQQLCRQVRDHFASSDEPLVLMHPDHFKVQWAPNDLSDAAVEQVKELIDVACRRTRD